MLKILLSSFSSNITPPEPKPESPIKYIIIAIVIISVVITVLAIINRIIEKIRNKKEKSCTIIICNNCNAIVSEKDVFCPKCGVKLKNDIDIN
ncbi:MAG: zinc-ribbon domain-containing protein [Clostridia bacterium]|nr:zinc-ribbon domain-containing protein [Clostridia bacterium]